MINLFKQLKNNQRGATSIVFAGFVIVLVMLAGSGIDIGRAYLIRNKTQLAMDAALLGGVANLTTAQLEGGSRAAAVQRELNNLFQANYPRGYFGSTVRGLRVRELDSAEGSVFEINVIVTAPNTIMSIFGFNENEISLTSQVTLRDPRFLELTLVLDTTGSMGQPEGSGTRMDALKDAVAVMINTLYDNNMEGSHVSIVPYYVGVNVGADRIDRVRKTRPWNTTNNTGWKPEWFDDEVSSRTMRVGMASSNSFYFTDTAPSGNDDTRFVHPYDYFIASIRDIPNVTDALIDNAYISFNNPPYTTSRLEFALTNRNAILNHVNSFGTFGATRINVGLMWGWYTLSSKWAGVFDNTRPGIPSSASNIDKVLVLMTDGQNTVSTHDNGEMATLCTNMKDDDITIYTIGFGPGAGTPGSTPATLLKNCATREEFYYYAPSAEELSQAFAEITDDILHRLLTLSK